jgi:hypothetical protein
LAHGLKPPGPRRDAALCQSVGQGEIGWVSPARHSLKVGAGKDVKNYRAGPTNLRLVRATLSASKSILEAALSDHVGSRIAGLLEAERREAALRRERLGPVVEAAWMVRACCETIRLLAEEMETSVAVHLELLDAVLRTHYGSRWWEQLEGERS